MNLIFSIPAMQEVAPNWPLNNRPGVGAVRRVAAGSALYRIGDTVQQELYQVHFGAFKIRRADSLGGGHLAALHLQTELLGLDAVGLHCHASEAIALTDSGVFMLHYAQLAQCGLSISDLLCQARVRAQDWTQIMRTGRADQRMAALILNCARRYAGLGYSARSFRLPMSRGDLADLLGLTPESVSRGLGRLHAAGLLEIHGTLLSLRDVPGLTRLLGDGKAIHEFAFGTGLPATLP